MTTNTIKMKLGFVLLMMLSIFLGTLIGVIFWNSFNTIFHFTDDSFAKMFGSAGATTILIVISTVELFLFMFPLGFLFGKLLGADKDLYFKELLTNRK